MANNRKKALFVSYNASTEPIFRSQVLPYLVLLSEKGIQLSLVTFEKEKPVSSGFQEELRKRNIDWIRLRFHSTPVLLAKVIDLIGGFFTVWRVCSAQGIGIVHGRAIMASLMALMPAKLCGAFFVFDMKSSLAEAYRLSGRLSESSLTYRLLAGAEHLCVRYSDEVIVETNVHKESLEEMLHGRKKRPFITVLPCCVEVERFKRHDAAAPKSPDSIKLVYLGSLSGWYMVPQMLDLFRAIKEKYKNAQFLFLTDDAQGHLAELVRKTGISGVQILKVRYEDVPAYLSQANAGVLFKWPNARLDSFPIKVGEYLAAGLPIIVNKGMGDVEELIRAHKIGVIVASFDKYGYQKTIEELEPLIVEQNTVRDRCANVASRHLSSVFGFSQYASIYDRISS